MSQIVFHHQQLILAGPTASGKSALAIALAQRLNGEVVNIDAFQLYEGMDLCTAKPNPVQMAAVPHHLYGVLKGHETCDAARYVALVTPILDEIRSRGVLPILVGGSGLYIKAITHGLSDLPRDEALRQNLVLRSLEDKVTELLQLDPEAPANVNLKNDRYVTRALEICLLTGKPQSQLRQEWENYHPPFTGLLLEWDRDALADRISRRTQMMFDQGIIQEIESTDEALSLTASKAIGVREIRQFSKNELTLEQCKELVTIATRQYAKRQRTWFRRETGFLSLPMQEGEPVESQAERAIELLKAASSDTTS